MPAVAPLGPVCDEFAAFNSDLTSNTPRSPTLPGEADRVALAGHRSTARLGADGDALTAYVHRPDFPTQGNVFADPVQALVDDCNPTAPP